MSKVLAHYYMLYGNAVSSAGKSCESRLEGRQM